MTNDYCDDCWNNPVTTSYVIPLVGQAIDTDLNDMGCHRNAEDFQLEDGETFYHYFADKPEVFSSINLQRTIASRAYCKCSDCLNRSMKTDVPHYGDGAYGTANSGFCPHSQIDSVTLAHGINFAILPFRAVIMIHNPTSFVKFDRTGGVIRSIPQEKLTRNDLVFMTLAQGEVLRIERWNGTEWIAVGEYEPC